MGVIVARGASKRIPRKVIRPLLGAPLLAWAGRSATASRLDRVIVSTEDEEIAAVDEERAALARRRRLSAGAAEHVQLQ